MKKAVFELKQTQQRMECAGSLTPELEGAAHSAAHPKRQAPPARRPAPKKGGCVHE